MAYLTEETRHIYIRSPGSFVSGMMFGLFMRNRTCFAALEIYRPASGHSLGYRSDFYCLGTDTRLSTSDWETRIMQPREHQSCMNFASRSTGHAVKLLLGDAAFS